MDEEQVIQATPPSQDGTSLEKKNDAINFQLDCLKIEISQIETVIGRLETYSQNSRNFSIALWIGGLTIMIGDSSLRPFLFLTSIIPILFWIIDARWIRFAKGPMIRAREIKNFINSSDLQATISAGRLHDFIVYDVMGEQYRGTEEYSRRTSFWHIIGYRTLYLHYGTMIILSLTLSIII